MEINLLAPSYRSESGYRLYGKADVVRLQQIVSLRQIGFSLEQIRDCLEQSEFSPHHVVQLHLSKIQSQIQLQQRLYTRLKAIALHLHATEAVSSQEFIQLIEATTMVDQYYTPEQQDYLNARREQVGEDRIQQVEAEWPQLMAEVRAEMAKGTDPASEVVQALARRWLGLIQEFTGDDAGVEQSLQTMYQQEGPESASQGAVVDPEGTVMWDFIGQAIALVKPSK
ncbi:MAG: TipAS antibiotic-recognition domain-containing protein [Cyanobacteria bacterium J06649_5]